ncbi:MAG: hypothetical protein WDM81_14150 [Rhizomicrobium sp.]
MGNAANDFVNYCASSLCRAPSDIWHDIVQPAFSGDPMTALDRLSNGLGFAGALPIGGAISAAEELPREAATLGEVFEGFHPDTMLHLTPSAPYEFEGGLDSGNYFARLGDVSHLTVNEYRIQVVGPVAGGFDANATTFLHFGPEQFGSFKLSSPSAYGFNEYVNTGTVVPNGHVTVHPWDPGAWLRQ